MKTSIPLLGAVLLALLPMSLPAAEAQSSGTDRIIVKWRGEAAASKTTRQQRARALSERLGNPFARGRNLGGSLSVLHLSSRQGGAQLARTLAALRADPNVEFAEVDERVRVRAYVPNDPLFSATTTYEGQDFDTQWYLKGAQPAAIRVDTAWDITKAGTDPASSTVVVAVIDTGIRPNHPDLAGKLLPGFDFISCDSGNNCAVGNDGDGWDPDPTDTGDYLSAQDLAGPPFRNNGCGGGLDGNQPTASTWHGTRVAGLIGATTDNNTGMAGAAFNARIVPIRALGKCGGFLSDVLAGMYWAAGFFDEASGLPIPAPILSDPEALAGHPNLNPAQIINMSLGASGSCTASYATAVREITAVGVLIVAAAGNDGGSVDKPANCPGVLAVAGIRHAGTKVGYSNLGSQVGIAAPAGNCVYTLAGEPCVYALNTLTNLGDEEAAGEGYTTPSQRASYGTSFSSPLVAATAGLMKAVNPSLTPKLLIARIKASSRTFPTTSDNTGVPQCVSPGLGTQGFECICNTSVCGAGMLDAAAAVLDAQRPAALAVASGPAMAGGTIELDGSSSEAAVGRNLASWAWTVEATADGATTPVITGAGSAAASVPAPSRGVVTVRLTVTDDSGATDFTRLYLTSSGGSSDTPPPVNEVKRGSGSVDLALLGLLFTLLAARLVRRRALPARPR